MIKKKVDVVLTRAEVDSPEPIEIKLNVICGKQKVTYTIDYPKGQQVD